MFSSISSAGASSSRSWRCSADTIQHLHTCCVHVWPHSLVERLCVCNGVLLLCAVLLRRSRHWWHCYSAVNGLVSMETSIVWYSEAHFVLISISRTEWNIFSDYHFILSSPAFISAHRIKCQQYVVSEMRRWMWTEKCWLFEERENVQRILSMDM